MRETGRAPGRRPTSTHPSPLTHDTTHSTRRHQAYDSRECNGGAGRTAGAGHLLVLGLGRVRELRPPGAEQLADLAVPLHELENSRRQHLLQRLDYNLAYERRDL